MLKRIVVIGPESTGKSTLCGMLAQHFGTDWCPEFAREYLLTHGTDYSFDDLLTIAKGQLAMEDEYAEKAGRAADAGQAPALFIDTDSLWRRLHPAQVSAHAGLYLQLVNWAVDGGRINRPADKEAVILDRRTLATNDRVALLELAVERAEREGHVTTAARACFCRSPCSADHAGL